MAVVAIGGSVDLSVDVGRRFGVRGALAERRVSAILQGLRRELREFIIAVWPVDTGASLQAWSNRISGTVWLLRNPIDYAEFVHREGESVEVWTEIERESESLIDGAGPEIAAASLAPPREAARPITARRSVSARVGAALFTARATALRAVPTRTRQARRVNPSIQPLQETAA